ncbi:MAG TPA: 50S ribosomal protein L4 [Gemmatimonadaceae bacterium]|nr:50S ribosomal protein L4 [Gemmatimonadaceae bacterium]
MADTTQTFEAAAYTANGTARDHVALPEAVFDGTINMPVMHQAVKAYLANQRQGNAQTKTRGFVAGGNQKPWRQKGTGRARQGSIRAPHWVGGGTVFGPIPRSYAQFVPRQVRALARKSAFNARAREGAVMVIDRFAYDAPKTARLAALVARLGLEGRKVLILTNGVNEHVYLSGRNLTGVQVMPYSDVSAYHVLWSDAVLVEGGAIGHDLPPVADTEPERAPKREKPAKAAKQKKTARKAASKKTAAKHAAAPAKKKKTTTARAKSASKKTAAKKTSGKPKKRGK